PSGPERAEPRETERNTCPFALLSSAEPQRPPSPLLPPSAASLSHRQPFPSPEEKRREEKRWDLDCGEDGEDSGRRGGAAQGIGGNPLRLRLSSSGGARRRQDQRLFRPCPCLLPHPHAAHRFRRSRLLPPPRGPQPQGRQSCLFRRLLVARLRCRLGRRARAPGLEDASWRNDRHRFLELFLR
uniref:Uncharacterized protein n=1 Tax=Oryza glumipatula TaxID=40148 RepID=A0A0E0B8K8_9ORYZ